LRPKPVSYFKSKPAYKISKYVNKLDMFSISGLACTCKFIDPSEASIFYSKTNWMPVFNSIKKLHHASKMINYGFMYLNF